MSDLVERLLPCPFCGGEAEIHQVGNEHTPKRGFEVKCRTWNCVTKKRALVIHQPLERAREFAITAWNRRSPAETERDTATLALSALRAAMTRLASMEAFEGSRFVDKDNPADQELLARINFAEAALSKDQTGETG